jgi:dTDP-4-amino-4,6-dideoxygalactose transaminase
LALANCTVSLHLALRILDIKKGDEVICPSLSFVATANAIRYEEAVPVFADIIGIDNLTIDPEDIRKKITSKTKAIMVMHYGGFPCDMNTIMKISADYNLRVIEDACHGPLSEYHDKKLGTIGDVGCFSFFSNKNISTGEGGMLVTRDTLLFEKAKLLRSHGMTSLSYERAKGHSTSYDVIDLGYNYRLDDIHSSIGLVQLQKHIEEIGKRKIIRQYYIDSLKGQDKIAIPFAEQNSTCSNYIFTIVLKNSTAEFREEVRSKLSLAGIQTSVHYPAIHRFSIYRDFYCSLPRTEYVSDNLITLPMYSKLKREDIAIITSVLNEILND